MMGEPLGCGKNGLGRIEYTFDAMQYTVST